MLRDAPAELLSTSGFAASLAIAALLLGALPACEDDRRVPYIAPELHDWPARYEGRRGLALHIFETGTLEVPEAFLLRGGSLARRRTLPVFAYVLAHPKQGLVLWNTGLRRGEGEDESRARESMLDLGTRVASAPGQDLASQMRAAGLAPGKVRWVVLSNLRRKHTGEIGAFPEARVVVSRAEHRAAQSDSSYRTADFDQVASWRFLDLDEARPLGTMPAALDLFGDGSCLLLDASGPTPGNLALLIRLPTRPLLLAGDLAPVEETLRHAAEPARLSDRDAWWERIWQLKRFRDLDPKLLVVPEHDLEALRTANLAEVRIHEPPAGDRRAPTPPAQQQRPLWAP